ncbi:uncharacterized protein LOC101856846 [Aplysia californica]|uniref:Uncharacterized protein LOC101856846 n=1 Tax=Aplysia californica TaxID=6500 RepID=A0ABM0K7M4_APLCA|nr:uncharacterized protein LOC101856846 [Aplysia californica]
MKQSVQKKTPTSKNNGCFNNVEASSSPEAPDDELNAQEEVPGKTLVPSPFPFSHHTPAQKQSIVQKASWKSENEHLVNKVEACSGSEAPDDELNTQGEIPGKTLVPSPFSFPYQKQSVQKRPWKSENEYLVNKVEACSGSEGSDDECITQEEEVQGKTLVRSELSCHPAQIELVQKTPGRPKKTCPCPSAQKEFVEKAPGKPKKKRPFNIVVVEPNGSTESSDSDDELDTKEKMPEKTAAAAASQLPSCHSAQKEFVRETLGESQSKLPVNVFVVEARSSSEEASEGEHDAQKKVPEKTDTVLLQAPCLPAQQQSAEKTQRKRSRKKRRFDNGESSSNVEALDEETANLFSEHSYFRPPKGLELNLMEVMVALERSKAKVKSHSRTIKCLRQRLMRRDTTIASMTEELESLRKRLSPDEQNPVK